MAKRRVGKYPEAFRRMTMEQMKDCPSVTALAEELGVDRTVLYHWQRNLDPSDEGATKHSLGCFRNPVLLSSDRNRRACPAA